MKPGPRPSPGRRAQWLLLFGSIALGTGCAAGRNVVMNPPEEWIVAASVADVRAARAPRRTAGYDENQETQVLRTEPVLVFERRGKWSRIECPLQPEYTHNGRWQGYPGWIESKYLVAVSPTKLDPKPSTDKLDVQRVAVLKEAEKHLNSPYLWGGRSLNDPGDKPGTTGVDCSGLINWSFLQIGRVVPRDAHEQYMKARRIEPMALIPGDLIFLATTKNPEKMVHVAFYAGQGEMLESPQTGLKVRKITIKERLGADLAELKNGSPVSGDRVVYFGSLFEEAR